MRHTHYFRESLEGVFPSNLFERHLQTHILTSFYILFIYLSNIETNTCRLFKLNLWSFLLLGHLRNKWFSVALKSLEILVSQFTLQRGFILILLPRLYPKIKLTQLSKSDIFFSFVTASRTYFWVSQDIKQNYVTTVWNMNCMLHWMLPKY